MKKPLRQGEMDGLCGIYSVLNSVRYLLGSKFSQEDENILFSKLISNFYRNSERQPNPVEFVYKGITSRELSYLLTITRNFLKKKEINLFWSKPLQKSNRPKTIDQFWIKINESLIKYEKSILIMDYNWMVDKKESGHWTCATSVTDKTIVLYDSSSDGKNIIRLTKSKCALEKPTKDKPHFLVSHNVTLLWIQ